MKPTYTLSWFALALIVSCDSAPCTEEGCGPALHIAFSEPIGAPGTYDWVIGRDDRVERCQVVLDGVTVPSSRGRECGEFVIAVNGEGKLAFVTGPETAELSLSLLRDGVILGEAVFTPDYADVEINGPGCGSCPSATEQLEIDGELASNGR
jgi:hypothetical protein